MKGSIIWRCRKCGNKRIGTCDCPAANYSIVYSIGKRQRWEAVGKSKKNAEKRLAEILTQVHAGIYKEIKETTFFDFSQQWLRDYAAVHLKASTFRSYSDLVRLHFLPAFGKSLLTQITCDEIQAFLAKCMREKKHSPRTANYLLRVLKIMFKHARKWNFVRENPTEDIAKAKEEHYEMEYLRTDEIQQLLRHAEEPWKTLFMTAVLTGMRRGEVLALQWGDIDWHNNVIHVKRSLYWYLSSEVDSPKKPLWTFTSPKSKPRFAQS